MWMIPNTGAAIQNQLAAAARRELDMGTAYHRLCVAGRYADAERLVDAIRQDGVLVPVIWRPTPIPRVRYKPEGAA